MTILKLRDQEFEVEAIVFDKDGLLFDSQHFWKHLALMRMECLSRISGFPMREWLNLFGVEYEDDQVVRVDPYGIFAVATPQEEAIVTASLIRSSTSAQWGDCRRMAVSAFHDADREFNLLQALLPKKGFPDIFHRLREQGITYGIATSDELHRTRDSIDSFDSYEALRFAITPVDVKRGKPSPDMLLLASKLVSVPLDKIMMIGDSVVDVQMAREAGCIGVGIPDDDEMSRKMESYADCIIDSLDEIEIVQRR